MTQQEYIDYFESLTNQMVELTRRKNQDYSVEGDAFANFNLAANLGITSTDNGILVRMSDKFQRVINLITQKREGEVSDEKVRDTLMDLAIYSIILIAYLESEKATI